MTEWSRQDWINLAFIVLAGMLMGLALWLTNSCAHGGRACEYQATARGGGGEPQPCREASR